MSKRTRAADGLTPLQATVLAAMPTEEPTTTQALAARLEKWPAVIYVALRTLQDQDRIVQHAPTDAEIARFATPHGPLPTFWVRRR